MFAYITGKGKPVELGKFTFTCHIESEFEEMDRLCDDPLAVHGQATVEVLKDGEYIGEFVDIDVAYDKKFLWDIYAFECIFLSDCGNMLDDQAVFKDDLPKVYDTILVAVKSACKEIEPATMALLNKIEQAG